MGETGPVTTGGTVYDPNFVMMRREGLRGLVSSTIVTSRLIVLTQDLSADKASSIQVSENADLKVFGETVYVAGPLKVPGRIIAIACRQLVFRKDNQQREASLDVSGKDAENPVTAPAAKVADGVDGTEGYPAGGKGTDGPVGASGVAGGNAGIIEINCAEILCDSAVHLIAKGGKGSGGQAGQNGGKGGKGFSGYDSKRLHVGKCPEYVSVSADGGDGGNGGNGGDGGKGGDGGEITICCLKLDTKQYKGRLYLEASAGDGGAGGACGLGADGGDAGTPKAGAFTGKFEGGVIAGEQKLDIESINVEKREHWLGPPDKNAHKTVDSIRYMDGSSSGAGGSDGIPGYGGLPGKTRTIAIALRGATATDWAEVCPDKNIQVIPGYIGAPGVPRNVTEAYFEGTTYGGGSFVNYLIPGYEEWDTEKLRRPQGFGRSGKPSQAAEAILMRVSYLGPGFGASGSEYLRPGYGGRQPPEKVISRADVWKLPQVKLRAPMPKASVVKSVKECWTAAGDQDLAPKVNGDLLPMIFDECCTRFLLTNVHSNSGAADLKELWDILNWVRSMASLKKQQTLTEAVDATLLYLKKGWNAFGKTPDHVPLGSIQSYKDDLKVMMESFRNVESRSELLQRAFLDASQQSAYLRNTVGSLGDLVELLDQHGKEAVSACKDSLAAVETMTEELNESRTKLTEAFTDLGGVIMKKIELDGADVANALSQLSFTNIENPALGSLMLISQGMDLSKKAMENIPTDYGVPINKKYVTTHLTLFDKGIQDLKGLLLKQRKDGSLNTNEFEVNRLLATREQVDELCSRFFEKYPEAKGVSFALQNFIDVVSRRNGKIEEYNDNLATLYGISNETRRTKEQLKTAQDTLGGSAWPGIPVMANFTQALRRHALQRCIEQLYMASRVVTLETLSDYDVFQHVLGKLKPAGDSPGTLDSTALDTALIDLIATQLSQQAKYQTNREVFPDANRPPIRLILTKETHKHVFRILSPDSGKYDATRVATFTLGAARKNSEADSNNPFEGMSDVRLSAIRCRINGLVTSNNVHRVELRHGGIESFVTERDEEVVLNHNSTLFTRIYEAGSPMTRKEGLLDPQHGRLIGPFCTWALRIVPPGGNAQVDITKISKIVIEFEGTHRSFA